MKKEYIKPTMTVTKLQSRSQLLFSSLQAIIFLSLADDIEIEYDKNGDDPVNAW
jgi:hypothetical protein